MAGADPEDCCRGSRSFPTGRVHSSNRLGCVPRWDSRGNQDKTLDDEQAPPVIIDGLPTIGKTRHATETAFDLDVPAAILTHRYETRDVHL